MPSFSERHGYMPNRSRLHQFEEMNDRLRNAIWNFLRERHLAYETNLDAYDVLRSLWTEVLGRRFDQLSSFKDELSIFGNTSMQQFRKWYSTASWNEIYDVLEFLLRKSPSSSDAKDINAVLSREGAAYRFIGGVIAPITSNEELAEVDGALHHTSPFDVAAQHIRQAVDHLSDRGNLDARNVIKEAISAVESAVRVASGDPKADIEKGLKKLRLHSQLERAWKNMYNWTSDEGGVRHGKEEISQVSLPEARYMVVASSAFVNYLIAKHAEGG